jgi:predicted ATPase
VAAVDRVAVDHARLADRELVPDRWFLDVPAIAQLCADGVELGPRVTVIVGENGSGKSTFVEALARHWAERLTAAVKHWTPAAGGEDSALHRVLVVTGERPRPQGGCFLRAEAMHAHFSGLDWGGPAREFGGPLNTRSHGESFLGYLESRLTERGLFVLDEPEAALSFSSCLRLLAILDVMTSGGSQVVMATHSPLLAAFPGARILEFGDGGITVASWDDLDLVRDWRAFLDSPSMYLDPLFDDA